MNCSKTGLAAALLISLLSSTANAAVFSAPVDESMGDYDTGAPGTISGSPFGYPGMGTTMPGVINSLTFSNFRYTSDVAINNAFFILGDPLGNLSLSLNSPGCTFNLLATQTATILPAVQCPLTQAQSDAFLSLLFPDPNDPTANQAHNFTVGVGNPTSASDHIFLLTTPVGASIDQILTATAIADATGVPEPATCGMMSVALLLGGLSRRKLRRL